MTVKEWGIHYNRGRLNDEFSVCGLHPTRDAENNVKQGVEPDTTWRADWGGLETERQPETEVVRKTSVPLARERARGTDPV